jgi:hypothetical protein
MLNSSTLNSKPLNGPSTSGFPEVNDWSLMAPVERQAIYVLEIGELRLPISSAQASMRRVGQSFLQVVVPSAREYVDALQTLLAETMTLRSGYRYADGSESPLEDIAEAPFEQLRRDEGPFRDTLTLSGYGERSTTTIAERELRRVQTRSGGTDGRRRVRCEIDLFLRPGHTAIDADGVSFTVGVIQYFIGTQSEAMEVIQDG